MLGVLARAREEREEVFFLIRKVVLFFYWIGGILLSC